MIATIVVTVSAGAAQMLSAAFSFAPFFVIVALGQRFVVTLRPGNVDLSIPATMTFAGTVATKFGDRDRSEPARASPG